MKGLGAACETAGLSRRFFLRRLVRGGEGGILFNCRVKTYTMGTGAAAGRGMNGEGP